MSDRGFMDSFTSSCSIPSQRKSSSSSLMTTGIGTFSGRRGNVRFSSAKFATTSTRPRKMMSPMLSFRSTKRAAARPARAKGVFESLLKALDEGIGAVKDTARQMKEQLPELDGPSASRQHYFMELEKQLKIFERKIRTLEVHRDRVEELRDEYLLKLKLRDGAFSLAQALANHSSKISKEKLAEARTEQKDLLEDLCDIEEELETKLGAFRVHITGFTGLQRVANGSTVETQVKLATQKWKARCKINRRQQQWQDNIDIFLLGKVTDELFIRVVEVKRMQSNIPIGCIKYQTRELFSFFPQSIIISLPNAHNINIKLNMDVRWSPLIGDDFIHDLDFRTVYCYVGEPPNNPTGNASCTKVSPDHDSTSLDQALRIPTSSNSSSSLLSSPSSSYNRHEVEVERLPLGTGTRKEYSTPDSVLAATQRSPRNYEQNAPQVRKSSLKKLDTTVDQTIGSEDTHAMHRSTDQLCDAGYDTGFTALRRLPTSLPALLESVLSALEEPKDQYPELKGLEVQLVRLEDALKGGRLTKAPSITLSESMALDSFDFLDVDEERRLSESLVLTEGHRTTSFSEFISLRPEEPVHKLVQSQQLASTAGSQGDSGFNDVRGGDVVVIDSTGCPSADRALQQHLLHCEYLLQHLQANGPLNRKLISSLRKLSREADVIRELLNIAADPSAVPKLGQLLPELAADEHLMRFWNNAATKDDLLCVGCESFMVALDKKYGHILWKEFPDVANKVFSEVLSRVLGLEGDECDPVECKMVVTVFQFAAFFLQFDDNRAIPKSLKEIAQELRITEGLRDGDINSRRKIASLLPLFPFNQGALLASAHLLSDDDSILYRAAVMYLGKFSGNSPWRAKAEQFYLDTLEHSDQDVRVGACTALGELKATSAVLQLKYLAKSDFDQVKRAARRALSELGSNPTNLHDSIGKSSTKVLREELGGKLSLHRTRSAEGGLQETGRTIL